MYYRIPRQFLIPVVTGDIAEEYIRGGARLLKEEDLVEKKALEEADKEYIESQIQGPYSEQYGYYLEISGNIE
ncbi:MAG TPA: hypothetical protein VIK26_06660 [Clostridium sp.]